MQILDKLCQSFGSDVLQVLLNSAENVATCSHHVLLSEALRLTLDQGIAVFSSDILTLMECYLMCFFVTIIKRDFIHSFFNYYHFSIRSSSWHNQLRCQQLYGLTIMLCWHFWYPTILLRSRVTFSKDLPKTIFTSSHTWVC